MPSFKRKNKPASTRGIIFPGTSVCKSPVDDIIYPIVGEDHYKGYDLSMPILEMEMNPSEPFIADDFLSPYFDSYDQPAQKEAPQRQKPPSPKQPRQSSRIPRMAFGFFRKHQDTANNNTTAEEEDQMLELLEDTIMTTPLHEAARLGSGDFVRLLLVKEGVPNFRNGTMRTALQMGAGGRTAEEDRLLRAQSQSAPTKEQQHEDTMLGIRAPVIPADFFADPDQEINTEKGTAKRAALAVGRIFKSALRSSTKESKTSTTLPETDAQVKLHPDPDRLNLLLTDRMDAILALMTWVDSDTGENPSINAVDSNGRTALHYAAELGRADVCLAILSNFGAMLTIVDELGAKTPCELAAERGHPELAAQLEARAVLYADPYGLDDELMAAVLTTSVNGQDENDPRGLLVPPFNWFETLSPDQIQAEWIHRSKKALGKMKEIVKRWDCSTDAQKIMATTSKKVLEHALVGEIIADSDSDDEVEDNSETSDDNEEESHNVLLAFANLQEAHAGRFLSYHKWKVSAAMDAFRKNPCKAFHDASIPFPKGQRPKDDSDDEKPSSTPESQTCLICYDDNVEKGEWVKLEGCVHGFCGDCLRDYLSDCAVSKSTGLCIPCPHHECGAVISTAQISSLLSENPDVLSRLTEAAYESFITSSADFRFCPHPGCTGVVRRVTQSFLTTVGLESNFLDFTGAVCTAGHPAESSSATADTASVTYEGIRDPEYVNCRSLRQPRKAHRFCFACGEGIHWPVTCERLEEWKQKMWEEIGDSEADEEGNTANELAQKLWLKANTRPCPQVRTDRVFQVLWMDYFINAFSPSSAMPQSRRTMAAIT
jgi:ankyrin repeat protein